MKNPPRLILCVDQAAKSGWCIVQPPTFGTMNGGEYGQNILDCGMATTFAARRTVLEQLRAEMATRGLTPSDVRMLLEDHSRIPSFAGRGKGAQRGTSTFVGMGKAWGRWEEQAMFHGIPASHVHGVAPQTWRAAMLGSTRGGDVARAGAVELAERVMGRELAEDAAEAVCIGLWAAANLERVLRGEPAPKKPRKKRSRKKPADEVEATWRCACGAAFTERGRFGEMDIVRTTAPKCPRCRKVA